MSHDAAIQRYLDGPPGHARVLGPPGSGKTTLLVERYRALVARGHSPLVIGFSREQRDALLEVLLPDGAAILGALPVTTHGHLASTILDRAAAGRPRTLRDVDEQIVLDRVLESQPDLLRSDLRSIADSRALRDALLQVLHVLAQNGVGAADAEAAAKESRDARAKDVLCLFAACRRHLDERGLVTFYDAAWKACLARDSVPFPYDAVLVDDFQDLDRGQFELIRSLAPPNGPTAVEVFGDPTGSRFSFRGTSDRFLMEEFPAVYAPADFQLPPPWPTDAALAASVTLLAHSQGPAPSVAMDLASLGALPLFAAAQEAETEPTSWQVRVRSVRAEDEVAEAQHAAGQVREWLEQGIAPGDIAVVARDPERVASLVHHVFRERGVPIDVGDRADSAADAFVHALIGALGRDADGRFAEALEASPLMRAFCDAGRLPRDAARAVAALHASYSSRGNFDLERLFRDHTASIGSPWTIARVTEEWNRYAEVVTHSGGHPSLDEFRHAYLDTPVAEKLRGDAPALLSARAVSGRAVRAAVVLGCADGVFPRVEVDTGYIPHAYLGDALTRVCPGAARDLHARVDRERAEREEMALLLSALVCARDELCFSHPRKSGDQIRTLPQVLAPLFEGAPDVARHTPTAFRAAAHVARAPADAALAGAAREVDPMAGGWIQPPIAPRRPTFEELALSPSRLQTFTSCQRKFFFQRILRIAEPGSIYLEIGNVFHEVLKDLVPVGATGDEVRAVLQSDAAAEIIDRAISKVMPGAGEWLRGLTTVHMHRMLEGVRKLEEKRQGSYRVLSVETSATYPVEGNAVLTGRLDRVDDVEELGPVVVDYKTSSQLSTTAASIVQEIEEAREHWQVVIYSALAGALGHDAKAFVYYVVPPGEDVNAVGLQLTTGRLREIVRTEGRQKPRYDFLPPETVRAVLDDAMKIHADVLSGACAYDRTDDIKTCDTCHFIRVCRRTGE